MFSCVICLLPAIALLVAGAQDDVRAGIHRTGDRVRLRHLPNWNPMLSIIAGMNGMIPGWTTVFAKGVFLAVSERVKHMKRQVKRILEAAKTPTNGVSLKGQERSIFVGKSLRVHRLAKGLTLTQVADRLSELLPGSTISKIYISNIETGVKGIAPDRLANFCIAIGTTPQSIYKTAEELALLIKDHGEYNDDLLKVLDLEIKGALNETAIF